MSYKKKKEHAWEGLPGPGSQGQGGPHVGMGGRAGTGAKAGGPNWTSINMLMCGLRQTEWLADITLPQLCFWEVTIYRPILHHQIYSQNNPNILPDQTSRLMFSLHEEIFIY